MRITLLVILLGALALTWWALHPEEQSRARVVAGNERIIDYFVEGLELTTFDAQGFPLRRLESDSLRHYRGSGETLLARPRFTLFGGNSPLWRVVSESGTLAEDHSRLDLEGAVEIHRSGSDERPPIEIRTRNVLVKPDEEYAETAEPVRITSGANWINAVGMRAWLRPPGRIQFLSRTRAYYAAQ